VVNAPSGNTAAVAELTLALLLSQVKACYCDLYFSFA
jgi:phosphoglycerate dehydrogenase-like enzyme